LNCSRLRKKKSRKLRRKKKKRRRPSKQSDLLKEKGRVKRPFFVESQWIKVSK
jgi:hypothetical protein